MSESAGDRSILLVPRPYGPPAPDIADRVARTFMEAGIDVRVPPDLADDAPSATVGDRDDPAAGVELAFVLGGDGTILRGAELVRGHGVPVLGLNLGHVGFLAEAESDEFDAVVDAVVHRRYAIERRMALAVQVVSEGAVLERTWALNEAALGKDAHQHMLEMILEIDDRPISRYGADGLVCATPTGSTAYAFSAGGPVVWPEVEALVVVPISAHALFARPMVVSPTSRVAIELGELSSRAVLTCDGRRIIDLPERARVEVTRDPEDVLLARLHPRPFADRLVEKFDLPVEGWRGRKRPPG